MSELVNLCGLRERGIMILDGNNLEWIVEWCGMNKLCFSLLLCAVLSLLVLIRNHSDRNTKTNTAAIPGPTGLPIFGNIFQLGDKLHETFMQMADVYGDVFQLHIASRRVVVLNGSRAINQALARQAVDFAGRPDFPSMSVLDETTGRGLSFSPYSERWRLHKKVSERALRHFTSGQQVGNLQQKVLMEVEELINIWTNNNRNVDVLVSPERSLQLSASNVIGSFLFSERYALDDKRLLGLLDIQSGFGDVFSTANLVDFMPWLLMFAPKLLRDFHEYLCRFRAVFEDVMNRHLENHKPGADKDIMDYMLTLAEEMPGGKLTPTLALSSTYDFFGAGADTVPATVMWLISYMMKHPGIQAKVHKELDSVLSDRTPSLEDRCRLPFTEAVIAEVQRHSSVVALAIPHSTTRDTVLGGGYDLRIQKGTVIFVNYYSVNHDPRIFMEPDRFAPQRFLKADGTLNAEMIKKLVVYGIGRRRCLGSELARVELFLYTTTLMQRFQFDCPDGETLSLSGKPGLVSKPTLGAVRLRSRLGKKIA